MARRTHGTGSLYVRRDARGREYWYGQWWAGDCRPRRRIGPKRERGSREGLTRTQAERQLRKLIDTEFAAASRAAGDRPSVVEVAERYVDHREQVMERKRTTIQDYRIIVRGHFARFFADKAIERIGVADIESYMRVKRAEGLAPKTIQNQLNLLNAVFRFGVRRGWIPTNPVAQVERPKKPRRGSERRLRFLQPHELERLIHAVPDDYLGLLDRVLYLCAAYTGLRQGELLGLRWIDIDWAAMRIRVADSYTRGELDSPKSDEGRSVPMATRVATELEQVFQSSAYQDDQDLVFCHPHTGHPYDPSKLRKRFYKAMGAAGMGDRCGRGGGITFHALRHTFGTQLAAAGAPLRAIQEWMGHADAKTTEIYRHYAPDPTQGADLVERAFASDASQPTPRV